jgi:hypothetical protein
LKNSDGCFYARFQPYDNSPFADSGHFMPELKGDKLFVNLGASQTRKWLRGFGHGVRKVQSAGRDKAVIIHTATGQHLAELEAQFADVGFSKRELGDPVEHLPIEGLSRDSESDAEDR